MTKATDLRLLPPRVLRHSPQRRQRSGRAGAARARHGSHGGGGGGARAPNRRPHQRQRSLADGLTLGFGHAAAEPPRAGRRRRADRYARR